MSISVQIPVQIAWVTHDLDSTESTLTALLGAGKWVRTPAVHFGPDTCVYRGAPADFVADISLSYAGDMQLEVIRPVRGESVYREFLDDQGPGLHHVCTRVDDPAAFATAVAAAAATGADIVTQGVIAGGLQFAYLSAPTAGVPFLEITYVPDSIQAFFDHIKKEQA
jgi:catechol 2,3-dioxygenase-like lactoylglutathione lyase family enzyme